jgi:uncharacterized membrane protein
MEVLIVVGVVLVLWTNESLFGKPLFQEKKPPTPQQKFTNALRDYLEYKDGKIESIEKTIASIDKKTKGG